LEILTGTKLKIFQTAVVLFCDNGYSSVSIRDIAKASGINSASIYNHYTSKEDILNTMYDYYEYERSRIEPDFDEIMKAAETVPLDKLPELVSFYFPAEVQPMVDRIIIIAALESRRDARAADLVKRHLIEIAEKFSGAVLRKLIDIGRIEPFDVDALLIVLSTFCHSAALRNLGPNHLTAEEWTRGLSFIFSMARPKQ